MLGKKHVPTPRRTNPDKASAEVLCCHGADGASGQASDEAAEAICTMEAYRKGSQSLRICVRSPSTL